MIFKTNECSFQYSKFLETILWLIFINKLFLMQHYIFKQFRYTKFYKVWKTDSRIFLKGFCMTG